MEPMEILFIIILSAIIVLILIWAIKQAIDHQNAIAEEEEQLRLEEEAKELKRKIREAEEERKKREEERKKREEEEFINSTLCAICEDHSYGKVICKNCWDRAEAIQKDISANKKSSYQNLYNYHTELQKNITFFNTHHERKINSIMLLATDEILSDKYFDKKTIHESQNFLEDFYCLKYIATDEFITKYIPQNTSEEKETPQEPKNEVETEPKSAFTDFRKENPANYRCDDGHYVRSKSERDIDNFFFNNDIFHIYESKYEDPSTGKTFIPDFYLPKYKLYIEYFGMNTEEYNKKRQEKIEAYRKNPNINFDYVDYTDDFNITEKLQYICKKHNIPVKY